MAAASITFTSTGATLRQDTDIAFKSGQGELLAGFDNFNRGALRHAIIEAGRALEVNKNGTQSTAYTVQASIGASAADISIYIG